MSRSTAPVPTVAGLLAALHATTRDDQATRLPDMSDTDRKDDQ